MPHIKSLALTFLLIITPLLGTEGKIINPITDVCWECLFPITVGGVNVTPSHQDQIHYSQIICKCPGLPPKIGVPMSFWEPSYLVDVTRHAYKLIGLGGVAIGEESVKNRGCIGLLADGPAQNSFYQCHLYSFPIIALLEILTDFSCVSKGDLELAYFSELDPTWADDRLALITNPEAGFFANPLAQVACVADCAAATAGKPLDKLFWCGGCEGSLYPYSGTVAHHVGACQASALLTHRVIAKLHRAYLLKGYEEDNFCEGDYMPILKKSLYKTQLAYPISQTSGACHPLGKSDLLWGVGKSYPHGGEDFVYLLWVKKQCCLDAEILSTGGTL
jgi:conjugal transfer pilus assembly protein TraU